MKVYQEVPSGQSLQNLYGNRVLKVTLARFSQCVLQLRVQERLFDRATQWLFSDKAVSFPSVFCVCAGSEDCRYAKENQEYEVQHKKLLPTARPTIATLQQKTISSEDYLEYRYILFLQASRTLHCFEELYVDYGGTGSSAFVESDYLK